MRICVTPKAQSGGIGSFRYKFTAALQARGHEVVSDPAEKGVEAVLVIGGTRNLPGLWQARRRGIPVIQRLNGMNWIYRLRPTGWRHFIRSEYGNRILAFIRARLATAIIYQSDFSHRWWERRYGPTQKPYTVVYNGVDLDTYTPNGPHERPADTTRLLVVEGSLADGYEYFLEIAVALAERLGARRPVELMVAARVDPAVLQYWKEHSKVPILYQRVGREYIPQLDRSAHLLYPAELNAACPNAVIEAMACGLPVIAFDTGSLPELVAGDAGRIVPYGGDAWKLERPDIPALADVAGEILADQPRFRAGARGRAMAFGLDTMVERYLAVLGAA